jgi:hypothetical protein
LSERLQKTTPVAGGVEDSTHFITTCPIAVEAAMLQLDTRDVASLRDEPHLQLCLQIRVVLPVGVDVPGQY